MTKRHVTSIRKYTFHDKKKETGLKFFIQPATSTGDHVLAHLHNEKMPGALRCSLPSGAEKEKRSTPSLLIFVFLMLLGGLQVRCGRPPSQLSVFICFGIYTNNVASRNAFGALFSGDTCRLNGKKPLHLLQNIVETMQFIVWNFPA